MRYYLLLAFVSIYFTTVSFAQSTAKESTVIPPVKKTAIPTTATSTDSERGKTPPPFDIRRYRIEWSKVNKDLKEIEKAITNEDNSSLPLIMYITYAGKIDSYSKAPNIEVESKTSCKWFELLSKSIHAMYDSRFKMNASIENKDIKTFTEAKAQFLPLFNKYVGLMKNPLKLTPEQLKDARKKLDALDKQLAEEDKQKEKADKGKEKPKTKPKPKPQSDEE